MATRQYGFLISASFCGSFEDVTAKIIVREDGKASPINPRTDGESAFWDAPKHLDGLMLDNFGIHGFVSNSGECCFLQERPAFAGYGHLDCEAITRMGATFKRVNKEIAKSEASEPGDIYSAIARSLRLEFAVWQVGENRGSFYSDNRFHWASIGEGREHFRGLILDARNRTREKHGKPALAA